MTDELQQKVERAIRLLQSVPYHNDEPIEIAYSGGKDSDVILELARMAHIRYVAIYHNTTIDPPGTIRHARDNGVTVLRPDVPFFKLLQSKGLPSRCRRFCCSALKEKPIYYNVVIGIRRSESKARRDRYPEPIRCRVYSKQKNVRTQQILPILDWSDSDELEFIRERGIRLHPLYYREDGTIDIKRRLGCMCCPLQSKRKRIEEFKRYPLMLRQYVRNAAVFYDKHPDSSVRKWAASVYEWVFADIMYDTFADFRARCKDTLFPIAPTLAKVGMEKIFNVDLEFNTHKEK